MKPIFLSLALLIYVQAADENFYRDANGVTIHCENAAVGETETVDGITYTKGNGNTVDAAVACTSGITSMSRWFSYEDTKLGQGRENVKQKFKDEPELAAEIEEKIKVAMEISDVMVMDTTEIQDSDV